MKIIVILFIVFLFSPAYGGDFMEVSIAPQKVEIGEQIFINIIVQNDQSDLARHSFIIPGLENFTLFSQTEGSDYRNINWEVSSLKKYSLGIMPQSIWSYEIWPIEISSASWFIVDDQSFSISVWQQNIDWNKVENIIKDSDNAELKGLRYIVFPWLYSIILLFVLLSWILLYKTISRKTSLKNKTSNWDFTTQKKSKLLEYFSNLDTKSYDFFRRYNTWLREVLALDGFLYAPNYTLSEVSQIEGIEKNPAYKILRKSYKYEFTSEDTSQATKQKYKSEIISYINS